MADPFRAGVERLIAEWEAVIAHRGYHPYVREGYSQCAFTLRALLAKHPPTPQCIGYPNCDGDLEGESHSPECPVSASPPSEPSPVEQEKQ